MFLTLSGLAIAGLITLGVTVFGGGTLIAIGANEAEEQKKQAAKANIETLKKEIQEYEKLKSEIITYYNKGELAIDDLNAAKNIFKDGGHVNDGVPLADDKIKSCIAVLKSTNTYLDDCIKTIDYNISVCESKIEEEKKKL